MTSSSIFLWILKNSRFTHLRLITFNVKLKKAGNNTHFIVSITLYRFYITRLYYMEQVFVIEDSVCMDY